MSTLFAAPAASFGFAADNPAPERSRAARPKSGAERKTMIIGRAWLLALRFALLNLAGCGAVLAAWRHGLLAPVMLGDATKLAWVIVGAFAIGLALAGQRVLQVSSELNEVANPAPNPKSRVGRHLAQAMGMDGQGRANLASALKMRLSARLGAIRHVAGALVLLGLIGTVIGFMIALSGIDPEAAADVGAVGPMVSTLIDGMGTALSTTLVGSVLNIWLMLNHRLLEGGMTHLLARIIDRAEALHARPLDTLHARLVATGHARPETDAAAEAS